MAAPLGTGSFNGLAWGPGTKFHVTALSGLDDLPPVRPGDADRPADPGLFRGRDLLAGRTVLLELRAVGDTNADMYVQVNAAMAAFVPTDQAEMQCLFYSSSRLINARVRRRAAPYDAGFQTRFGKLLIELFCTDPRVYDAVLQQVTIPLATATGGRAYPYTFPTAYGSGVGGTAVLNNTGIYAMRPTIHIVGPVDNPIVSNDSTGKSLKLSGSLTATDYLDLDLDARSIVLNGTASRRSWLLAGSSWWELLPGANVIRYSANTVQVGSTAQVTFRPAYV